MGLDITAYSKLRYLRPISEDLDADGDAWGEGLIVIYKVDFDRMDGLSEGVYQQDEGGLRWEFRAGSYSGYNDWRRELSRMALNVLPDAVWDEPDKYAGQPFVELINFSDAEGNIGPKTSAKLLADFEAHEQQAVEHVRKLGEPEQSYAVQQAVESWFLAKYRDWMQAFRVAADSGFVVFH